MSFSESSEIRFSARPTVEFDEYTGAKWILTADLSSSGEPSEVPVFWSQCYLRESSFQTEDQWTSESRPSDLQTPLNDTQHGIQMHSWNERVELVLSTWLSPKPDICDRRLTSTWTWPNPDSGWHLRRGQ